MPQKAVGKVSNIYGEVYHSHNTRFNIQVINPTTIVHKILIIQEQIIFYVLHIVCVRGKGIASFKIFFISVAIPANSSEQ